MRTATQEMMRVDLRYKRAQALAGAVLHKLGPQIDATDPEELPHRIMQIVHDAMFEVMMDQGVEDMTDYTRSEAGLPPRGPDGWTVEEMVALEQRRLELLTRPLVMTVPQFPLPHNKDSQE
jgi:hypothetical protein